MEVLAGNLGVAPLEITSVAASGAGFGEGQDSCSGARLVFGETCAVEALFTPLGPDGSEEAEVTDSGSKQSRRRAIWLQVGRRASQGTGGQA